MEKMKKTIYKILIICTLLVFGEARADSFSFCFSEKTFTHSCGFLSDSLKRNKKAAASASSRRARITFETFDANYARAVDYYNRHQFLSAAKMFEELYPLSLGTSHADTILYMFADCYYQNKDFEMAAFHFKDYARRYPGSDRAELASLMAIKSVAQLSPYYALDQTETLYAIDELNMFINLYPHSQYMDECNKMLDAMRDKLAKKELELLKLYYDTENYRAAQIATDNFLKSYSYSRYAPEAAFVLVKNNYEYAKKSVPEKMKERYESCIAACDNLKLNFPESGFVADAQKYRDDAKKQIEKIVKKSK